MEQEAEKYRAEIKSNRRQIVVQQRGTATQTEPNEAEEPDEWDDPDAAAVHAQEALEKFCVERWPSFDVVRWAVFVFSWLWSRKDWRWRRCAAAGGRFTGGARRRRCAPSVACYTWVLSASPRGHARCGRGWHAATSGE